MYATELLTQAELQALIEQCNTRYPTGKRNRALLVTLWRTGLRISEALALKPKDLNVESGTVTVLHGKGNKRRVVGMDEKAFSIINDWLSVRPTIENSPLFCTLDGGTIHTSYIRTLLPRLAKKAGISKRTHAHGFRHLCACEMSSEGIPVDVIRDTLGHSNLATTDTYLRRLSPERVIKTMRQRNW